MEGAFRGPLRGIEAVLRKVGNLALEDGIEVRIRGRVDYYPPQGRVQFMMNAIDPRYALGQLAAQQQVTVAGTIVSAQGRRTGRKHMLRVVLEDASGRLGLSFFLRGVLA